MMRRLLYFLPACVFLMIAAAPAFAVIDNTHHDMNTYLGGSFTCYACHGYRQGLAADNNLGTVGSFCYNQCHRGTGGIAGAIPVASDFPNTGNENGALWPVGTRVARGAIYNGGTASTLNKYANGHMRTWSNMPTIDNVTTKPAQTNNWPHVGSGDMQCTGCHDVHSNTYAPFLRAPLSVGTGAASAAATFCVQCHTGSATSTGDGRWHYITSSSNANGAHPIETDSATASTRAAGTGTPTRHGRLIYIKGTRGAARNDANDNSSIFKALSLYATGTAGLGNPANHYRPGGKLGAMNTPADNGAVICITCHGVHLPGNVAGTNNLTYVTIGDQSADTESVNPICVACHGPGPTPTGTSNANPGVSSYYHPVNGEALSASGSRPEPNYTASTGTFTFTVSVGTGTGASDLGVNLRLVCTSCHTYGHGGPTGTMLLTSRARTCGGCHNTTAVQTGSAANSHHRYGGTTDYTQAAGGGYTNPSYASTYTTVNLANGLGCEDCHVFNGTAHNW
jgi:predicted CXXCH cytochrome family protein